MAPEVVRLLLKRRPFVPFVVKFAADMASEMVEIKVDGPEMAKMLGDETLEVFDSRRKETLLIDLRLVPHVTTPGRLEL
jgi:hypothetical protein